MNDAAIGLDHFIISDLNDVEFRTCAVDFSFGMLVLADVLAVLENENVSAIEEFQTALVEMCKFMYPFFSPENRVKVVKAGASIYKELNTADHPKVDEILSNVQTLSVALVYNETEQKVAEHDLSDSFRGLLEMLHGSLN